MLVIPVVSVMPLVSMVELEGAAASVVGVLFSEIKVLCTDLESLKRYISYYITTIVTVVAIIQC